MLADRYELDREIGRGGMGSVWLGRDTVLGRTVAIKKIGMAPGGGAPDLARAEREARLAARINHRNVVAVFDLVVEDGHQWLVMEHVAGPTLAGLIAERGALDPGDLAPVVEQVAGALSAAHDHGIVHRDVKPSNILLTPDGVAKLSDFGIARAHADASFTQTGLLTGSPAYLSPEVVTGGGATAASDVWSLGATAFHALAGHPPYEVGDNLLGAMYRIVHEDVPRLNSGGSLVPLVEAMMQHDPDARPTMTEVERAAAKLTVRKSGAALDATQAFSVLATDAAKPTSTTTFAPLETRTSKPRARWLVAAAVAIIAIIAGALILGGKGPNDEPPRAEAGPSTSTSTEAAEGPTAESLEGFAADYLTTASNNPDEGFALLAPAYQQESGGLEGYKNFWDRVSDLDIQTVRGDPDKLTVFYTYSYEFEGDRRTEDVTLQLVESAGGFLVSGAA